MMRHLQVTANAHPEPASAPAVNGTSSTSGASKPEPEHMTLTPTAVQPQTQPAKAASQSQETSKRASLGIPQAFYNTAVQTHRSQALQSTGGGLPRSPQPTRPKAYTIGEDKQTGSLGLKMKV